MKTPDSIGVIGAGILGLAIPALRDAQSPPATSAFAIAEHLVDEPTFG